MPVFPVFDGATRIFMYSYILWSDSQPSAFQNEPLLVGVTYTLIVLLLCAHFVSDFASCIVSRCLPAIATVLQSNF